MIKLRLKTTRNYPNQCAESLGTLIGPASIRKLFLSAKTNVVEAKLNKLAGSPLPYQHQLLLLRQCIQHDLRHLQQTMETSDCMGGWKRLNDLLQRSVRWLRGRVNDLEGDRQADLDAKFLSLPARFGGVVILSYQECALLARAAAIDEAEVENWRILGEVYDEAAIGRESFQQWQRSQHKRCDKAWSA